MTNATVTAINTASAEARALAVITACGASELQAQAVFLAIQPLAKRAYLAGNDREQWANKPTDKRPLRPFWATLYAAKGFNKDGSPKWVDNKKPVKAMRAAAATILATMDDKTRDKTDDGLEIFMLSLETIITGIIAPAAKAPAAKDAAKDAAKAAAKVGAALEELAKAANDHLLTDDQWAALVALAAKAPAAKATAKAPAAKATATAPAAKATAKAPAAKATAKAPAMA